MSSPTPLADLQPPDVFPAEWNAPTGEVPVPAQPLPGWLLLPALLTTPIMAERLGPRVGCTPVAKLLALQVAVFVVCLAVFVLLGPLDAVYAGDAVQLENWSERLRYPLIALVEALQDDDHDVLSLLLGVGLGYVGLGLAGWLLMPLFHAGDTLASAYLRTLRYLVWSVTCVQVVLTGAWFLRGVRDNGTDQPEALLIPGALFAWYFARRLGFRYAGAARGVGWQPRTPHCPTCGYILTHQPLAGRCPECGTPARLALAEHRQATRWGAAWRWYQRPIAYVATAWAALVRGPAFAARLRFSAERDAAHRFLCWTSWLAGAAYFVFAAPWSEEFRVRLVVPALATALVVRLIVAATANIGCSWGVRDPRRAARIACYLSPHLLLLVTAAAFCMRAYDFASQQRCDIWLKHQLGLPTAAAAEAALLGILALPGLAAGIWGLWNVAAALRRARWVAA